MNLQEPGDFVDVFIASFYPEDEDWRCYRDVFVDGIAIDYVFEHIDGSQVLIVRTGKPIVSSGFMNELSQVAKRRQILLNSGYARVAIVCGSLLLQPEHTPSNVEVVSLIDQYQEFIPEGLPMVQAN